MGTEGDQHSLDVLSYWCAVELFSPQTWHDPQLIQLAPHGADNYGLGIGGQEYNQLPWEHVRANLFIGLVGNDRCKFSKLWHDLQEGTIFWLQTNMDARLTEPFSFTEEIQKWLVSKAARAGTRESFPPGLLEKITSRWVEVVQDHDPLPVGTQIEDSMVLCLLQTVNDLAAGIGLYGKACAIYRKSYGYSSIKDNYKRIKLKKGKIDGDGEENGQLQWLQHERFRIETGLSQNTTMNALISAARMIRDLSPAEEVEQDEILQELASRKPKRDRVASFMAFCIGDDGFLIPDSLVISQYAKAVSCLFNHRGWPECPSGWPHVELLDGDEDAAKSYFADLCKEKSGAVQGEGKPVRSLTSKPMISDIINMVANEMGLGDDCILHSPLYSELDGTPLIRNRVSYRLESGEGPSESEIMDSFYLSDLERLYKGGVNSFSEPVRRYLSVDHPQRFNLAADQDGFLLDGWTKPGCMPLGRWPSSSDQFQSLGQQLAVNQIRSVAEQSEGYPLLGVNGPPGTGKTTLLRDVVAEIIVTRARRLAKFSNPEDIFQERASARDTFAHMDRPYWTLDPSITGFEIVVASSNNRAVENVSKELPSPEAIAEEWESYIEDAYGQPFYGFDFRNFAGQVASSREAERGENDSESDSAWALISAVLGKSANRSQFLRPFKDDFIYGTLQGLRKLDNSRDWAEAKRAFLAALAKEESIRARKTAEFNLQHSYSKLCRERSTLLKELNRLNSEIGRRKSDRAEYLAQVQDAESQFARARQAADTARYEWQQADGAYQAHLSYWKAHPLRSLFHSKDRQKDELEYYTNAHQALIRKDNLSDEVDQAQYQLQSCYRGLKIGDQELRKCEDTAGDLSGRLSVLEQQIRWVEKHPRTRQDISDDYVACMDKEWNKARTEVFIRALALHQQAVEGAAKQFQDNLALAFYVMQSNGFTPGERLVAWQTFFLVVPVISTSFASVSRMLSGLGRQALGWAIVDEAGQAQPQSAAGLLQRVRHAVAVGDPMQIPPVDTMPKSMRELLASTHNIHIGLESDSMQVMVDYQTPYGLKDSQSNQWVGMPLVVHRRCDEPMFSICNSMAYSGRMIRAGTEQKPCTFTVGPNAGRELPISCWYNVSGNPGEKLDRQWRVQEGDELLRRLRELFEGGIRPEDIMVMAPFKVVADRVRDIFTDAVLEYAHYSHSAALVVAKNHAGTIHTSQGREADVVFLVLGSKPGSQGAGSRSWVNSSPNLLNVAVSRAKRRIYVIGNRIDWQYGTYSSRIAKNIPAVEAGSTW